MAVAVLAMLILVVALAAQDAGGRKPKSKADPVYPEMARRFHLSGTVKVQVVITPAGTVKSAKAVGGHPVLADAAVDAARKWRFEPSNEETTQVLAFNFVE